MFGNTGGSTKGFEIMAGTLLKGLGINEEWLKEKAETFLSFVRDIRDNTAVTRSNSETIMSQNADILAQLQVRHDQAEMNHGRQTDGGRKRLGHVRDPGSE